MKSIGVKKRKRRRRTCSELDKKMKEKDEDEERSLTGLGHPGRFSYASFYYAGPFKWVSFHRLGEDPLPGSGAPIYRSCRPGVPPLAATFLSGLVRVYNLS
ncbi:hypothetical protein MRX96_029996 [Rhipicephalus microplus]